MCANVQMLYNGRVYLCFKASATVSRMRGGMSIVRKDSVHVLLAVIQAGRKSFSFPSVQHVYTCLQLRRVVWPRRIFIIRDTVNAGTYNKNIANTPENLLELTVRG